jgi:hypothetical protein
MTVVWCRFSQLRPLVIGDTHASDAVVSQPAASARASPCARRDEHVDADQGGLSRRDCRRSVATFGVGCALRSEGRSLRSM